jgi:hypothetical protein
MIVVTDPVPLGQGGWFVELTPKTVLPTAAGLQAGPDTSHHVDDVAVNGAAPRGRGELDPDASRAHGVAVEDEVVPAIDADGGKIDPGKVAADRRAQPTRLRRATRRLR